MPGLTVGWEYLTGYSVAANPSRRDRAEWPPHPGRVFMALAAAYFETSNDPAKVDELQSEYDALRWLEGLGVPELYLPLREQVFERSAVTIYVPANDKAPAKMTLQSLPSLTRSKQPRTFPRIWVGHEPCFMHWPRAAGVDEHRVALERLCRKVTRIGHSSSLVQMWVDDNKPPTNDSSEVWVADDEWADNHFRVATPGTLDRLPEQTQIPRILQFAELDTRIRSSKGAEQRNAKEEFQAQFGEKWKTSVTPPPLLRPKLGIWQGYRRETEPATPSEAPRSHFDTDLLVLTYVGGPQLPAVSTLTVTRALRNTVMSQSSVQPAPAWVSGHDTTGQPLRAEDGHMACIPLPVVGYEHADGHLLGVGLVFPRAANRRERGQVLGKLLLDETGQPKPVELMLGRLGVWTVVKRDWSERRFTLQPEEWTAHPGGASRWASATPVVLDKFPKTDRVKDRGAWTDEVIGIVAESCTRIGLPRPAEIDIDTTSWHRGSSRAVTKHRPLRGHLDVITRDGTAMGDGFPSYPAKGANAPRPQVHVWLRFSEPVVGPVLIGAGRYLGYGLCKPLEVSRR